MCAQTLDVEPVLTVVAASRNDDHGGDPLVRTQLFLNGISFLASKYERPVEVILVDWNPVPARPGLAGVLKLPAEDRFCTGRVITVPMELHQRFKYSDVLGFFQMIAKNAGIRRARGRFVLATNIDILFSEALFDFMTGGDLRPDRHYRVDRHDIAANLPVDSTLEQMQQHAWSKPIRTHRRFSPPALIKHLYPHKPEGWKRCEVNPTEFSAPPHLRFQKLPAGWSIEVGQQAPATDLHTNGCGDFALLSRDAWSRLRGYPEFEAFSFNIDSIGLMQSHFGGITEVTLLPPYAAFHLEHSIGSGWTPEGERKLFKRLNENRILNPDWTVLNSLVAQLRSSPELVQLNDEDWGLAAFELPEEPLLRGEYFASPAHPRTYPAWPRARVGAILPAFDFDRIALWEERRIAAAGGGPAAASPRGGEAPEHILQLFWPDHRGDYSEDNSHAVPATLVPRERFFFFVPVARAGAVLRLDPTYRAGIVEFHDIEISCPVSGRILWSARAHGAKLLQIAGTACALPAPEETAPLRLLSTGSDPQVLLPPLPPGTKEQVLVSIELAFFRAPGMEPAE